jgi:hypothetical protein
LDKHERFDGRTIEPAREHALVIIKRRLKRRLGTFDLYTNRL